MANFIQQFESGGVTYQLHDSEFIVDNREAGGAALTGVSKASALFDGMQITYWLAYAAGSNATLELTLAGGTTTGAIPCYYSGTTRLTTHYGAGNAVHLTYRENVTIGTTTIAAGWWADANYYSDSNYDIFGTGHVDTAVYQYSLCAITGTSGSISKQTNTYGAGTYMKLNSFTWSGGTGTSKRASNKGFWPGKIFYHSSSSAVSTSGSATSTLGSSTSNLDLRYTVNGSTSANIGVANAPFFLVGSINATDGLFYLKGGGTSSSGATKSWWQCGIPTDTTTTDVFWFVGMMSSKYQVRLADENWMLKFVNGVLTWFDPFKVALNAEHANSATNANYATSAGSVPVHALNGYSHTQNPWYLTLYDPVNNEFARDTNLGTYVQSVHTGGQWSESTLTLGSPSVSDIILGSDTTVDGSLTVNGDIEVEAGGTIYGDGQGINITPTVTIADGDRLILASSANSSELRASSITFGTNTTTYLRNDGTWVAPPAEVFNITATPISASAFSTTTLYSDFTAALAANQIIQVSVAGMATTGILTSRNGTYYSFNMSSASSAQIYVFEVSNVDDYLQFDVVHLGNTVSIDFPGDVPSSGDYILRSNGAAGSWVEYTDSDENVKQTNTTENASLRLLLSTSATDNTETGTVNKSASLFYNPSTTVLSAPAFSGVGTSLTALNATNLTSGTVNTARLPTVTRTDTTSTATPAAGATVTMIDSVTSDTLGRVTGVNTKTVTLPNSGGGSVSVTELTGYGNSANPWYVLLYEPDSGTFARDERIGSYVQSVWTGDWSTSTLTLGDNINHLVLSALTHITADNNVTVDGDVDATGVFTGDGSGLHNLASFPYNNTFAIGADSSAS